jgi:hypothetical protein
MMINTKTRKRKMISILLLPYKTEKHSIKEAWKEITMSIKRLIQSSNLENEDSTSACKSNEGISSILI